MQEGEDVFISGVSHKINNFFEVWVSFISSEKWLGALHDEFSIIVSVDFELSKVFVFEILYEMQCAGVIGALSWAHCYYCLIELIWIEYLTLINLDL